VSEAAQSTKVEMSASTAFALCERGGNLYISTVGMGMLRTSMNSPDDPARFDRFSGDGWSVYVDRDIEPPTRWVIKWTRWPRPTSVRFTTQPIPNGRDLAWALS
jgi:hypothetical protein